MRDPHPGEGSQLTRRPLLVVALALVALGACSAKPAPDAEPTAAATVPPVASANASPSSTPGSSAPAGDRLVDGRNFGYIKSFNAGAHTMTFDLAEFHSGADADKAAREDGVIGPGEHVENDYYIRNKNKRLRVIAYEPDVALRVIDWQHCCDLRDGDLPRFIASFAPGAHDDSYHGPASGYWLTSSGGVIVQISEQYQP